ncbi:MAG TPA: DUF2188 domain-containing protein [Candidatus Obscuribacterales bacterium]
MSKANVHVVNKGGTWQVETEGNPTAGQGFATREEAIAAGKEKAKQNQVELLVHREDGTIGERDSYGNDPRDVPG